MKIFIDISPGFYKTKLLNEVCKHTDILVIYTTDYDERSRNSDFLKGDRCYPHLILRGNKLVQAFRILWILLTVSYEECIVGGYVALSDWIPLLFDKRKNSIILESTFRETSTSGIRGLMKRIFFRRVGKVYACGTPHEKLARDFGFKGEVRKWYSVGLINLSPNPVYSPRTEVRNFLFVGRLIWQKNLKWLIDRFAAHSELTLTIVGFGEDEERLKSHVQTSNVRFVGAVDNTSLRHYYQDADVFILPSLTETWGLVVEEALNNGTPVMLSHMVGAADDLVINQGTGVVFRCGDITDFEEKLSEITNLKVYNETRQRISTIDFIQRERYKVEQFIDSQL